MAATFLASIVWNNAAKEVTQPWGPTTLTLEPPYVMNGHTVHWHCGIDIGLYSGTPIFAARSGKVTRRTSGILGVTTSSGQTDYYVHGTYSVLLGAIVARGQMLGWSGAVIPGGGSLTGPHLHFEVQPPGGLINRPTGLNPVPILSPAQSAGSGTLGDFMAALTDAQQLDMYQDIQAIRASNAIRNAVTIDQIAALLAPLGTKLDGLQASLNALEGGGVAPTDLSQFKADLAAAKAGVDKLQSLLPGV